LLLIQISSHRTENYREVERVDLYATITSSALRPVVRPQYIHSITIKKGIYISSKTTYFCRRIEEVEVTVSRESLKRIDPTLPLIIQTGHAIDEAYLSALCVSVREITVLVGCDRAYFRPSRPCVIFSQITI
jgi:hypothetical protein